MTMSRTGRILDPTPCMPRIVLAAFALFLSAEPAAQMFKCVSDAGKVTYSSSACAALGLKDAGEVRDQLNVSPAGRVERFTPPPPPAAPAPAPAAAAKSGSGTGADAPAAADDDRRCFKTAKGYRCNEKPE